MQHVVPKTLTYGRGKEGHGLRLFAIIVDGQVPDARVHILDEACVVGGDGYQAALHGHGPLQTLDILGQQPPPVQQLHKVKLETERQTDSRQTIRVTPETVLPGLYRLNSQTATEDK